MRLSKRLHIPLLACLAPAALSADPPRPAVFESGPGRAHLVELYSSEGCSSCPPADEWMASLRRNPGLWRRFVPVEFHVDYWNRLGWTDPYSRKDFTQRQSTYASGWGSDAVYTPGRVLDGQEWKDAFDTSKLAAIGAPVGTLSARVSGERRFHVTFLPRTGGADWVAYGVLLGNGLKSRVKSGENAGRVLSHEFVALTLVEAPMHPKGPAFETDLDLGKNLTPLGGSSASSVAIWVARAGSQAPIQAVGGDL